MATLYGGQLSGSGTTHYGSAGFGVPGSTVPATGAHGPAAAYEFLTLPAQNNVEIQWLMQTYPAAGVFYMENNTSATLTGAPDGSYSFTGILKFDGVSQGLRSHTINIGAPASIAGGALLTANTSIAGGSAIGGGATVAQGATISLVLSVVGGAASGGIATPVSFSGTVPTISTAVGSLFEFDFAPFFSGALTPLSFSLASGSLPSGISWSGSRLVGQATTPQVLSGLSVTATDTATNTATSNTFSFNVSAEIIPVRQISPIPAFNLRVGVFFSYDLAPHFQTTRPPLTFAVAQGAILPRGLGLVGSVLSGTPQESERHLTVPSQITVSDAG